MTLQSLGIATLLYSGFVAALFVLSKIVPGPIHDGAPLADGTRKKYKLNGLYLYLILAGFCAAGQFTHLFSLSIVHRHFWSLLVVANLFAHAYTLVLYFRGPHSEGFLKDAFMGTEVNPTTWGVDEKMFAYRPSLMGLGVLNWSFAAAQYEQLGHLTTRMWLYQIVYFIYLTNYFQFEYGMLYTWDIIAEKFGWMLVWGDYVLVPFFYSICGWYLLANTEPMPAWETAALASLFAVGFVLFRGTNEQKHQYKVNPQVYIWGQAGRGHRWAPVGIRILGNRAKAQLHGRADGLFRLDAHHRIPLDRAVSAAALAVGAVSPSRLARRAALRRQVRRAVEGVLRARALPHDSVRLLTVLGAIVGQPAADLL